MTFYTKAVENIDNSLIWQQNIDNNALPIACKLGDVFYNISGVQSESYIVFDVDDMTQAINLSVKHAKGILFTDMSRLANLASKVGIPLSDINLFAEKGIKGRKNFEVLQNVTSYPTELQTYVNEKNIPFKVLSLISSLDEKCIKFIASFVDDKKPSMQQFKQFVENVADYKTMIIDIDYSPEFTFPSKKSAIRNEIENAYKNVQSKISPVNLSNNDMFETSNINVSFSANNYDEYQEKVKNLADNLDEVATFYKLLKNNDIC